MNVLVQEVGGVSAQHCLACPAEFAALVQAPHVDCPVSVEHPAPADAACRDETPSPPSREAAPATVQTQAEAAQARQDDDIRTDA